MEGCCACGGPLVPLGQLGKLMHFRCRNCGLDQSQEQEDKELIKGHYPDGECPDCGEDIPDNATEGEECGNCGHVFW